MLACNSHYYLPSSGDEVLTHTHCVDVDFPTVSRYATLGSAVAVAVVLLRVFFSRSEQKFQEKLILVKIQKEYKECRRCTRYNLNFD